ncbi:virulence factor Mce family protein [Mycolicibacterium rhodesiae]|uniref:Mammalian cell entry protein n=1 Tax=Mycolicibacterium rhodesiae TaxID=36814 RepID=A0A1X0J4B6_MYCRH|nr:virulence factor Mce family protein [Mycolicibacterium rhodesiae]MCV7345475.1 virulence factor Mce family protein [Mycolicibacterium rhodesiae]ORB56884.1 mammalian cell entry protein [Mycolicibacterium rhodesiae]
MIPPHAASLAMLLVVVAPSSGCGIDTWQGLNSLQLPGTQGGGPGSFVIQAEMPDVNNIQPNSRVRVGDATVGHITKIELEGWHALVTMRLDGDVNLPENAIATIGLTSILGSQHIELSAPQDAPPQGRLHPGSRIPLAHSGSYPTVEQTLAAVSTVLNGGGLAQVQDITEAFSTAFRGREQDLRSLIGQLDTFAGNVNDQTDDIIAATESLNRLTGVLAANRPVLDEALKTVPEALAVLNNERDNLVAAADQLGKFSNLVVSSVGQSKANLIKELKDIGPVLESLANAGPSMTRALSLIPTFPFPNETIEKWQRGDYANMTAVVDLTLSRIDQGLFTGTRWEGNLTELEMQWGRTIGQFPSPYTKSNPLVAPYNFDQGP